jgi:glycosyltransferase involved in cell wall biosynthesis
MKILYVTSRYPWPPRRGDQMRALQVLDFLAAEHEVTLLTPAPSAAESDPSPPLAGLSYRIELYRPEGGLVFLSGLARALLKGLPLQSGLFYQPDLGRRLRELQPRHDLAILQLVRLAVHVDDLGEMPFVVDLIDSLALNVSRRAEVDRWWLVPALRLEARLLAATERRLAERALSLLVVCERDRQAMACRLPPDLAAKVAVVRLSVRERKVDPAEEGGKLWREGDKGPVLAMTGNLGYFVNADAATWWLRDVWPEIRRVRPDVRLVIAGDRPSRSLRQAIDKAGARLIESPRDLRAIIAQATVAIAPMRCGSGVPVKVLEAWVVGTPVLASFWAGAGTTGRQDEDFRLLGQDPGDWVAAVTDLLDHPETRRRLVEGGRRRLAADYSRDEVRRHLQEVIQGLAPIPARPLNPLPLAATGEHARPASRRAPG